MNDITTAPSVVAARARRIEADVQVAQKALRTEIRQSLIGLTISAAMVVVSLLGALIAFSSPSVIRVIIGIYTLCMSGIFVVFILSEWDNVNRTLRRRMW